MKKGFTTSELMISVAIFGVLALVLSTLWVMAQGSLNEVKANQSLAENLQDIRMILANEADCTRNLVGANVDMSNPVSTTLTNIKRYDSAGTQIGITFNSGTREGGITFQNAVFTPSVQVDLSHYSGDLTLTYRKANSAGGEISVSRHMTLMTQVQNHLVQKCWLRRDLGKKSADQTCFELTGGALNEWNATDGCTLTNSQWYSGTNLAATCPAGTALPRTANYWTNCRTVEPPGFTDPTPTSNGDPYFVNLNSTTKTCQCVYDVMTPPAVLAQFRCQILCVQL